MESVTVTSQEAMNTVWSELNRLLKRVATEFFNTTSDNLCVYEGRKYPSNHMESQYRDIPLKTIGPIKDLPLISFSALHGKGAPGYGAIHYKCRAWENSENGLTYALAVIKGQWNMELFLICKKSESARVIRACQEQCKKVFENNQIPILEKGVLDEIVNNTVGFLVKSKKIENYGIRIKRGIILEGDPGNGKTMVCRYLQKLCVKHGIDFGIITAAHIDRAYQEQQLNELFYKYKVSFFDDIDIAYMNRKKGEGKIATSLLTAMDGMDTNSHLIRIFTTNEKLDDLDPAFLRPGRIDKCINLKNPNEKLRRELVKTWSQEIQENIDVEKLINLTSNFSFADMESIKTFLVTNKIIEGNNWNLEKAFKQHKERNKEESEKIGF